MLTVGSIMTRQPVTVPPGLPVESARALMHERRLRHVPVVSGERLVGLLSIRDLLEKLEPPTGRRRGQTGHAPQVRDRMSASLETVTVDESVLRACRRILERRVGCLPVMQGGRLAGVLSETDLLRLYTRVCRTAGRGASFDPPVESCMSREVLSIVPETSAAEAFELCRAKGIRHLPVLQEGWLVGIVSDHDLLPVIARAEGERRAVADIMSRDFVAVTGAGTPLSEAARCMLRDGFHSLPVIQDGALKGIVTSSDVLQVLGSIDERSLEAAWTSEEALSAGRAEE
jgi:CBS domain-containing protein